MKKNLLILLIFLFVSFACKESTTESPINNDSFDFFPNSDGNYYYYNVSVFDTSGTIIQSGTRKSYYNKDTIIFSTPYQVKVDTFQLTGPQTVNNTYFRKSSTGVFNWVELESNGFYFLIPDSLRGGISHSSQYRMLYLPLELNQTWQVHKVNVDLLYIQFELFKVDSEVMSIDTLIIPIQNQTVNTKVFKIKYQAKLTTSLSAPPIMFEVYVWLAKGVGFIKWEGDAELINFFAGDSIYMNKTSVSEDLYSFKLN